ncbi:SDR family NAD(P)-dependent oxidoreductase [Nonomuraea sp. KC401]|uniref:SDR family NAD(P)-dependent oxidoreductase n=1 Tax=unclassified Nonomuraea TaxID=2593643 RepID=UPI0010FDC679|nr:MULTISPECIES: SDR family NAD(P)-dependent oxidoreductase [unclassified Nonomuraea]NBE98000.1 SDR family NAD(P)-dependent oxidoreductase [Nonomuraea sp. K271]TLF61824.1 SDR family NAD(P)-dependent oxidoreductase [Nonomuraea sp. KC401]
MGGDRTLRFPAELVELFARAGHDRNPLHLSPQYARATPYGEPVVHGALAALGALALVPARPGMAVSRLEITFTGPVLRDKVYEVDVAETDDGARVRLTGLYGTALTAGATLVAAPAVTMPRTLVDGEVRRTPRALALADLDVGRSAIGTYRADPAALAALAARLRLAGGALDRAAVEAVLWGSYLTGMELPGRQALLARLRLDLDPDRPASADGFAYQARVERRDERFRLVEIDARLGTVARARIGAFVREPAAEPDTTAIAEAVAGLPRLDGAAVVVGGSRGLGAALALGLARLGAHVTATYQVSQDRAEALARQAGELGAALTLARGDAADPDWCARLAADLAARHDGLDTLVCCAVPPLRPMRLEAATVEPFVDYTAVSLRLALTPVVALLPLLARRRGTVLLLSSAALDALPVAWPHYGAAKSALESVCGVLARAHPQVSFRTVRAPALATDLVDPLTRPGQALAPEAFAARLLVDITGPVTPAGRR